MSGIRFDGSDTCISINGQSHTAVVTSATAGCDATPGVEEIRVGESRLRGIVRLAGDVSVSGSTVFVTGGGTGGATRLRDLTDVAITTDANGDPIIADGAVLRWTEYETGGVWTSSDTLDGGGYT
jgi:hypothetical protein